MLLRLSRPKVKTIEVPYCFRRYSGLPHFLAGSQLSILGANFGQFAGIEPVTTAVGTLIDLDPPPGAEKVAMQLNPGAAGTIAFSSGIHLNAFIPFDVKQSLPGRFVILIDLLKLKNIKPDPAATALANIDLKSAHLDFSELVEASWAFHKNFGLVY